MRNYTLAILVIIAVVSCSRKQTPIATTATVTKTEVPAAPVVKKAEPAPNPVALYGANCARCHGSTGIDGGAPRLDQPISKDDIVSVINNGAGSMPRFAEKLSKKEINAITDFVMSLQPAKR